MYNTTVLRIRLGPGSSAVGDLAPPPPGASTCVWHLCLSQLGGGRYWPLVRRPGMLLNVLPCPTTHKNWSVQNVPSAETEKLCLELMLFQKKNSPVSEKSNHFFWEVGGGLSTQCMAQTDSKSRFICFQSPCFLIYVGLPSRERERERQREPESQRLAEKKRCIRTGHAFWPRTSKELAGTGRRWGANTFPIFPWLLSHGQVGAGSVGTDPGSAYQGWRGALGWKPWLLPSAQGRPSLPKLAGGSFWNGNSPHPPRPGQSSGRRMCCRVTGGADTVWK